MKIYTIIYISVYIRVYFKVNAPLQLYPSPMSLGLAYGFVRGCGLPEEHERTQK